MSYFVLPSPCFFPLFNCKHKQINRFVHNVRYGNYVTFKILVALASLQYLNNHEPHRLIFCIEYKPTNITCPLYYHQLKIMIIYEGTSISGMFLKCFNIFLIYSYMYKVNVWLKETLIIYY